MDENSLNLSELTEKIRSYLEASIPSLTWERQFNGTVIPATPTGTVSAASMEFVNTVKGADITVVTFSIYIVDPTEDDVEGKALKVRTALKENESLDGLIQSGEVSKIEFGAVTAKAGAALITYKAKLWL